MDRTREDPVFDVPINTIVVLAEVVRRCRMRQKDNLQNSDKRAVTRRETVIYGIAVILAEQSA